MCIQRKSRVSRNREIINRKRVQEFTCFDLRGRCTLRTEFGEAIGDVEDEDDQGAVCGAFDLEIAEEGVGAEEIEGFVYDVIFGWVAWGWQQVSSGHGGQGGTRVPMGAGPLMRVRKGRTARLPIWRVSGASLKVEW